MIRKHTTLHTVAVMALSTLCVALSPSAHAGLLGGGAHAGGMGGLGGGLGGMGSASRGGLVGNATADSAGNCATGKRRRHHGPRRTVAGTAKADAGGMVDSAKSAVGDAAANAKATAASGASGSKAIAGAACSGARARARRNAVGGLPRRPASCRARPWSGVAAGAARVAPTAR